MQIIESKFSLGKSFRLVSHVESTAVTLWHMDWLSRSPGGEGQVWDLYEQWMEEEGTSAL